MTFTISVRWNQSLHACAARRDPTSRLLFLTGSRLRDRHSVFTLLVSGPLPRRRLPTRRSNLRPHVTLLVSP
eukprot:550358-Prymnesium_polylepis.1